MGGRQGRRRSDVVTVVALVAVVLGAWLVVDSSAGSADTRATGRHRADRAASVQIRPGHKLGLSASGSTAAPRSASPDSSLMPSTVPAAAAPLTTGPPTTGSAPSTSPTPSTVAPAPVPTVAAVPVTFPTGIVTVPASRRAARHRGAPAAVLVPGAGTSRAAAGLIRAIDQQSGSRGAIPDTADNVELLGRWMDNEGGLWADNPLNTSLHAGSYPHQFTSGGQDTGIPIFPSLATGLAATATTLLSNPSYARILKVLGSGSASCISFARAVIQSPWAAGHYDYNPAGFCSGSITPVRRGRKPHHGG